MIASALPLLLLLALPDDPSAALGQLDRYGAMPECRPEEEITTPLFGFDHEHHFSRPKVVSAVADQEAALLPYLEHPNRKVVLRAVALLCHAKWTVAPGRVLALARAHTCERDLVTAADAMTGGTGAIVGCDERPESIFSATARRLAEWRAKETQAVADAIGRGDEATTHQLVWDLDALDDARAHSAAATLASVRTPRGIALVLRGLRAALGSDFTQQSSGLAHGIFAAQLQGLAEARHVSVAAAYTLVLREAVASDMELLRPLESATPGLEPEALHDAAVAARREAPLGTFARERLERLAMPSRSFGPERSTIDTLADHHDRPGLRAFVKDDVHLLADRREAATRLAELGDGSGLFLFESPEGLWSEERQTVRAQLVHLAGVAPEPVHAQAEKVLNERWPR